MGIRSKVKKLVIVQNKESQIDAPLYALLHQHKSIELTVYYTDHVKDTQGSIDMELGIRPKWDNLNKGAYTSYAESVVYKLWRRIMRSSPDVVVICGWYPRIHIVLALLLKASGTHVGVRADSTLEHSSIGKIKRKLLAVYLSIFDSWHPVGKLSEVFFQRTSIKTRPVYRFPYSVDVKWFEIESENCKVNRDELRARYNISKDDFVVIGVLKFNEREDPITLIQAVADARAKHGRIRLILVGDGSLKKEIELINRENGDFASLPGYVAYSILPKYYSLADVFVHPAASEPYGVSIQEALATGLPVIVSDKVGCAVDFISSADVGSVFRVGCVEELSSIISDHKKRQPWLDPEVIKSAARSRGYDYSIEEFERLLDIPDSWKLKSSA